MALQRDQREVVLVGGGHAHVQVLRRLAMEPLRDVHLTVVVDTPLAVYSGMVPGFVAGQYTADELEIDVLPLARRAHARVVFGRAVGVDAEARRIEIEGRASVGYDLASFDIGSTVAGLDLPGVREHALATRPINLLVRGMERLAARARRHPADREFRFVVVGGGVGGIELAFCLFERVRRETGRSPAVTLVHSGEEILDGYSHGLVARVRREAGTRGIELLRGQRVSAVTAGAVELSSGELLPCDRVVWAAGAASQSIFVDSGLPTDERGFVRTRSTLQVEGVDNLLAVGDCATLNDYPQTPKAGVYAVRQGPYVSDNLRAWLEGGRLRRYRPQSDFLTLLNLGDGTALGAKKRLVFGGEKAMRLKDWIDRRFMRRFQVLDPEGEMTAEFAAAKASMNGNMEMLCGGCASKVGQSTLQRALHRLGTGTPDPTVELGLGKPDDAASMIVRPDLRVVSSIDGFSAFTDDPYLVGRVSAVNALSDLYAKGVAPRYAQAFVAVPEEEPEEDREETLYQVLAGAREALDEAGATLIGGHTTTASTLLVGLVVEALSDVDLPLLRIDRMQVGQDLVLTKALGTGVLFRGDMKGNVKGAWLEAAIASMLRPNRGASLIGRRAGATSATDITGFGLAGHLGEMARASGVAARLFLDRLPALPGALELFARGERSTFHAQNERALRGIDLARGLETADQLPLLFDPQTSGGLVLAIPHGAGRSVVEQLHSTGDTCAAVVGDVIAPRSDGVALEVTTAPTGRR